MLSVLRNSFIVIAGLVYGALSANAAPITIDFESFFDGDAVTNQISGVTFSNATVLSAGISLNELDFPPHSGSNVIVDDGGSISILFDAPVVSVVGFFTYTIDVLMRAFDSGGNVVASANSLFESNLAEIGDPGSSPNELISLAFAGGISRIAIEGDPDGLTDEVGPFGHDHGGFELTGVAGPALEFVGQTQRPGLAGDVGEGGHDTVGFPGHPHSLVERGGVTWIEVSIGEGNP